MANPKERWTGQSVYSQEIVANLPSMFTGGESIAEVCVEIGISEKTYYDWKNKHPEFREVADFGQTVAKAKGLKDMRDAGYSGQKVNATLIIKAAEESYNLKTAQIMQTEEIVDIYADLLREEREALKKDRGA